MRKIVDYQIIKASASATLRFLILCHLDRSYELHGSPFPTIEKDVDQILNIEIEQLYYNQAMVKYEDETE